MLNGALGFSSIFFELRPFLFDGVKVWRIDWEIIERMAGMGNGSADVDTLMEGGIVHHNHGMRRQFGEQILHRPFIKDIGIDVGFKQASRE